MNCADGSKIRDEGWFIARGDEYGAKVYEYSYNVDQYGKGQVYEPLGTLSTVSLSPGTYAIGVDGGRGAHVLANYVLV